MRAPVFNGIGHARSILRAIVLITDVQASPVSTILHPATIMRTAPVFLTLIGSAFGYDLVTTYSGPTFFDGWDYYGHWDNLTNGIPCAPITKGSLIWCYTGDVNFVDRVTAISSKLTYVNGMGNAVIRVDNMTVVQAPLKRNSVMIVSKEKYGLGTVWVLDAIHVPYGCRLETIFLSCSRQANTHLVHGPRSGAAEQTSNILMVCPMVKSTRRS